MGGWIKLHRDCLEHWLYTEYRPLTRREAWETILLTVNYEPSKSLIKGSVYECGVGQSLLSLESWAKKFVWSIQQVRTFFKLLESDGMIKTEGLQYTTRLTVCNWDAYQICSTDEKQSNNKQKTSRQHTNNSPLTTIKEVEEIKEDKELKEDVEQTKFQVFNKWLKSNYPNVSKLEQQMTEANLNTIIEKYGREKLSLALEQMENYKILNKKYLSVYRTLITFIKNIK